MTPNLPKVACLAQKAWALQEFSVLGVYSFFSKVIPFLIYLRLRVAAFSRE